MVLRCIAVSPQNFWLHSYMQAGLCRVVALFVVLTWFLPLLSQAAQIGGNAECALPFGRHVPEAAARSVARTTAWLDALKKATDTLSSTRLVQWGAGESSGRQALVSGVFTPMVFSASKGQQVVVQVRLSTPHRTVEDRLRGILHEPETLKLRSELLMLERAKGAEARSLIERPVLQRGVTGSLAANKARIVLLGEQLEALWLLGSMLPQREGGRWRDPQAALPVLSQAEALDPDYAPLPYLLGEILLQLDRPQDALAKLDKALTLNPEFGGALYARGLAYLRLQLPALAERDLSAALQCDASQAAWWRARGALRMIRNETGLMCEDYTQACARGDCEGLALARERGLCLAEQ